MICILVPKEIKVVNKERKYNHYRLSAFCLSKTLSEIPLTVIQPFVYLSVIYWVANLNNLEAFFASLGVLMADVLAAQVNLSIWHSNCIINMSTVLSLFTRLNTTIISEPLFRVFACTQRRQCLNTFNRNIHSCNI